MSARQRVLFPQAEGAAGSRRAAIRRRSIRARKALLQARADMWFLAHRREDLREALLQAILLIDRIDGDLSCEGVWKECAK